MATTGVSSVRKTNPQGFMSLLSSAACEWFLIIMLFVDAAFSYLVIKFARYCELPTPCLFCSRMGKRKNESYSSLLCRNHQEEISSLVSCHLHGNLADLRGMCEECFTHFSRQNKLNSGSYSILAGKLGLDFEKHGVQSLALHKKFPPSPSGIRICSCCNKSWGERPNAQRMLQLTPVGFGASKANVRPPLPRVPGRSRLGRKDSLKKLRDKFSIPSSPKSIVKSGVDTLSHVGYTVLKVHSDSESEVPYSDDDDRNDMKATHRWNRQPRVQTDDEARVSHQAPRHVASLLDQPTQFDDNALPSGAFSAHGLEELNWDQPHPRPSIQARDVSEALVGQPIDSISTMSTFSILSEYFSASSNVVGDLNTTNSHDPPSMSNDMNQTNAGVDNEKEVSENPVGSLSPNDSSKVKDIMEIPEASMSNEINPTNTCTGVDNEKEESDGSLSSGDSSTVEEIDSIPQVSSSDHTESQRVFNDKGNTSVLPDHSIYTPSMSDDINPTNRSTGTDNEKEVSDGPLSSSDSSDDDEEMNSMSRVSSSDQAESQKVFHDEGNTPLLPDHSINAIESSTNVAPSMSNDINLTAGVDNEGKVSDGPDGPLYAGDSSKVEDVNAMPQVSSLDHADSQRGDDEGNTPLVPDHSINAIESSNCVAPSMLNDINPTTGVEGEVSDGPDGPLSADDSSKVEDVNAMPQVSSPDHADSQRGDDEGNTPLLPGHSINAIESSNNVAPSMSNDINPMVGVEGEVSDGPDGQLSAVDSSKVKDVNAMPQVSSTDHADSQRESDEKEDIEREVSDEPEGPLSSIVEDANSMPRASASSDHDEPQRGYTSSSDGIQIQLRPESLDGVSVSDVEVESVVYKLKQNMNELYKELEEERNAAAIAANQAMAMINRLQEEKAALHMEALQYLRMMDEQAEYDMEALERANDLLSEKEKELQDLEAELEYYRNSFQGNEAVIEDPSKKISSAKGKSVIIEDSGVPSNSNSSASNFEDEKLYLVQCLKKLEKRMHQLSRKNSEHKSNKEEDGLPMQNGSSSLNGSSDLIEDCDIVSEENNRQKLYTSDGEMDLANLENEIANLSQRLQALETDRDFLNHVFGVLQNGNDGIQFIQEIVHELQELRRKEF